jgi:tetratricopeptide (TPR) repeat protein
LLSTPFTTGLLIKRNTRQFYCNGHTPRRGSVSRLPRSSEHPRFRSIALLSVNFQIRGFRLGTDAVFFLGDEEVPFFVVSSRTRPHVAFLKKNSRNKTVDLADGYAREIVLIICAVLLIIMFAGTALVTRLYHKKVHALGDDWFARGESTLQSGNAASALVDYRNALVYSPNNPVFQLHLAQALAAANREEEASTYLVNLLAESPGSGDINLDLARISAHQNQFLPAVRYYHSAIYGVWETDTLVKRWNVRRELCEYLLDRGDVMDAQPEVIGLAQEVPSGDLARQKEAGAYLLRTELWDRALVEFQSVLKFERRDDAALAGAGTAEYQLGQYAKALSYFEKLSRQKADDPQISSMFEVCRQFVAANPLQDGLSRQEKSRRTVAALVQAASRIADCAHQHGESISELHQVSGQPSNLDALQRLAAISRDNARNWSEENLELHPDRVNEAMKLVFRMENVAAQACGEPTMGPDRILWLVGRNTGQAE